MGVQSPDKTSGAWGNDCQRPCDCRVHSHTFHAIDHTLAHMDAVAPIKIIPSWPSERDLNAWCVVLQQVIRERRQVLREAHWLQRTELLQKLQNGCQKRMDRPGEHKNQELMGKRVKQDAPEYRASQNPAKTHPDNLSGWLTRAKWSCWLKRVCDNKVDQCLQHAWGSDEEWDRTDD